MILIYYFTRVFTGLSQLTGRYRRYADLKVGVVPVMNLEWIQKLIAISRSEDIRLRRDRHDSSRMHDYVHYICPQFALTNINFRNNSRYLESVYVVGFQR